MTSEGTELLDGAFESEEGDSESRLEEGESNSDLMDRVRELEEENAALTLANESQKEAYERCLDEVANHVVQALINQRDVREECVKLKMRVYDLERQNRVLIELFHQRLHQSSPQSPMLPSPPLELCSECSESLQHAQNKPSESPILPEDTSNLENPRQTVPSPQGLNVSMEVLSPFLKKKAHILEVLRQMEQKDPMKSPLNANLASCCHLSSVLAEPDKDILPLIYHDLNVHTIREERSHSYAGCQACMVIAQNVKTACMCHKACRRTKDGAGFIVCPTAQGASGQNMDNEVSGTNKSSIHATTIGVGLLVPSCGPDNSSGLFHGAGADSARKVTSLDDVESKQDDKPPDEQHDACNATSNVLVTEKKGSPHTACSEQTSDHKSDALCRTTNAVPCTTKRVGSKSSPHAPENNSTAQSGTQLNCNSAFQPSPSTRLPDIKDSSPSTLLKIPPVADGTESGSPPQMGPQLLRNSKIPCRNNKYEVCHSPVMAHKDTSVDEDQKATLPKSYIYPATHSAPTSPPKDDDANFSEGYIYRSHSTPKASCSSKLTLGSQSTAPKIPHYENIDDLSVPRQGRIPNHIFEGANTSLSSHSVEEQSSVNGTCFKSHHRSPAAPASADVEQMCRDAYAGSAVWYQVQNHHSLPSTSAIQKAHNSYLYSSVKAETYSTQCPDPPSGNAAVAEARGNIAKRQAAVNPKRHSLGKSAGVSGHLPFKERLGALGKLGTREELQTGLKLLGKDTKRKESGAVGYGNEKSQTAGGHCAMEERHKKYTVSLEGKPYCKMTRGSCVMRFPAPSLQYEPGAKSLPPNSSVARAELESFSPRFYIAKVDCAKRKIGVQSSNPDPPRVFRSYVKSTQSSNPPRSTKAGPSPHISHARVQSPKPGQDSSYLRVRAEDRSKLPSNRKKSSVYAKSLPPPPRLAGAYVDRKLLVPGPRSAMEQKVMEGIEENVMKLQEQDKGQSDVKQKTSNGIASWFGLRRSRLPALTRRQEASKPKDDMKEWRLNMSSLGKDTKKKMEVESLNISKLMEKAEDLRKALEKERAYVSGVALERPRRGHSCGVMMDQTHGHLSIVYRGEPSNNFMQHILNRVDEKDPNHYDLGHRQLSLDSKKYRSNVAHHRNWVISDTKSHEEIGQTSDVVTKDDVTSEDSLLQSLSSQHFTASMSTHTLDSGIGTFPLPACTGEGRSIPTLKSRGECDQSAYDDRVGDRIPISHMAHMLERELPLVKECSPKENDLSPSIVPSSVMEGSDSETICRGTL